MTDETRLDRTHQRIARAEQRERALRARQRRYARQLQERGERRWPPTSSHKHGRTHAAPRRQQHLLLAEQRYWLNIYRRPM